MAFDPRELAELKARCLQAHTLGFEIARPDWYIAMLGGGEAEGVTKGSPAHLLALITKHEGGPVEATPKHKKAEKAEKTAAKETEKVEEKKVEEKKVEEKKVEEDKPFDIQQEVVFSEVKPSPEVAISAASTLEIPAVSLPDDSVNDRATVPAPEPKSSKKK